MRKWGQRRQDETFAGDMLRVKNFIPAISIEGFEADAGFRRGQGTFAQAERAMSILREKKLPFGLSCCYTSKNVDIIGSEDLFQSGDSLGRLLLLAVHLYACRK